MRAAAFLASFLALTIMTPCAAALAELDYGPHRISMTLQPGQDAAYLMRMGPGDRLTVELSVIHGGNLDFYLTNLTAYRAYKSGYVRSLYFLAAQSRQDAAGIWYSYDSLTSNEYVLLIDNTGNTEGGALPTGSVDVEGEITLERNVWTLQNILITAAAVAGIVLFMAYLRWPRKRA